MVPDSFSSHDSLNAITQMWYDTLYLNVRVDVVNQSDYYRRLESGDYDICLAELSFDGADAYSYIEPFSNGEFGKFQEELADFCKDIVEKSDKYYDLTEAIHDVSSAEKSLIESFSFIPLWYAPTFIVYDDDTQEIVYDVFSGAVMFEKARHY